MKAKHGSTQRGDTIVEVLISLAVVSLVLGGAYVTTNRSLQATRSAQERANALKLAESQLEKLKGVAASNPTAIPASGAPPFCIEAVATIVPTSDADCQVNTAGVATTAEPQFRLSITRTGNDYTVVNSWTDVRGDMDNQVQLKYRVYP